MPELNAVPVAKSPDAHASETAEIVVGIPTCNNAGTVSHAVQTAQAGLRNYYPSRRSVVVHCDGGSQDGTVEAAREAAGEGSQLIQVNYSLPPLSSPAHGFSGPGNAYRSIFQIAQKMKAKVCIVLESTSPSIRPEWVELLTRPVLEKDFDFVAPYYARHKYAATVTNGIVYPMVRALYGKSIRYPLGGDCAFSGRLTDHYLKQPVWNTELAWSGIELWVTTQAICGGFRVCQAFLGAKLPHPTEPSRDASAILAEVLGTLFTQMETTVGFWQRARASQPVLVVGPLSDMPSEPVAVNVKRMIDAYRLGHQTLQDIWGLVLPPASLLELKKLANRSEEQFRFAGELWARILYDFALGYRTRVIGRDHLLRALTPLYLGWVASYILETENVAPAEAESWLEKLCLAYEKQKPYLISRWRWPDRFNP